MFQPIKTSWTITEPHLPEIWQAYRCYTKITHCLGQPMHVCTCNLNSIDGFHGVWLHFRRARVGFSAVVCKIQASKCYIKSLPSVQMIREAASLKVKGPLYSCLLIMHSSSGSRTLNWQLETITVSANIPVSPHYRLVPRPKHPGYEANHSRTLPAKYLVGKPCCTEFKVWMVGTGTL